MTQWTKRTPGDGEMDVINSLKTRLTSNATTAREVSTALGDHVGALPAIWPGDGGTAWGGMVNAFIPGLGTLADSSDAVAAAIGTYVDTVDEIEADADALQKRVDDAIAAASNNKISCTVAYVSDPPTVSCTVLTTIENAATRQKKQEQADADAASISKLLNGLDDLATRRTTADNTFAGTVNGQLPGEWPATRAALADIGITNPMDMTDKKIADAIEKITADAIQDGTLTPEEIKRLTELFNSFKNNESVMADVFEGLGGENTGRLIDMIGNTPFLSSGYPDAPDLLDLAVSIRESLATGSAHWTKEQASAFANSLLAPDSGVSRSAVGLLFDGPPYLGRELALSVAEIIDAYERSTGDSYIDTGGAASKLTAWYHDRLGDEGGDSAIDIAGSIFETLAQYPDQATEFLYPDPNDTGNKKGQERIDYWYRVRDWSSHNHFEAPAALLDATQRVDGGPQSEPRVDSAAYVIAASIIAEVITALADNEAFTPENMNDDAANDFAYSFSAYMESFADMPLANKDRGGKKWINDLTNGSPGPRVDAVDLTRVFDTLFGREASQPILDKAIKAQMESELDTILNGTAEEAAAAAERLAALSALRAGIENAAPIEEEERSAAQASDDRARWRSFIGTLPIVKNPVGAAALSLALDWLAKFFDNLSAAKIRELIEDGIDLGAPLTNGFQMSLIQAHLESQYPNDALEFPPSWEQALKDSGGDQEKAIELYNSQSQDWINDRRAYFTDQEWSVITRATDSYSDQFQVKLIDLSTR